MIKIIKKPVYLVTIAIIAIFGGYVIFSDDSSPNYEFVTAQKGTVAQEVSVTGKVKPAEAVDLAFEKSGTVSAVYVDVGDEVKTGKILIALDSSELKTQLAQAEATLQVQEIKLEELLKDAREEELKVYETKTEAARTALNEAKKNAVDKIKDAYTKSDDAVRTKVDQFMENPKSNNPQLKFSIPDTVLETKFEWDRKTMEQVLVSWKLSLDTLTSYNNLTNYTNAAKANLDQVRSLLDNSASVLNALVPTSYPTQSTINGWKTDVSSARINVSAATTSLLTAEEKLKTAESNLLVAEDELALKRSGATQEQILTQKAEIEKAKANVENFQAQLAKTIIRSPMDGIITKMEISIGETVTANVPVVSIISKTNLELEANITEVDIAKIILGGKAEITLDAYGGDIIFGAEVIFINPAETIIEGVTTYKVKLKFEKEDEKIKPGMTTNITVFGEKREEVIVIPQRAVSTKDNNKIVRIFEDNEVKEVKVELGLRGSAGNIEIVSGINEGDKVIISALE